MALIQSGSIAGKPIGTLEELEQYGLDPRKFHSCSDTIQGENAGCPAAPFCPFVDRGEFRHCVPEVKGEGPFNVIQRTYLKNDLGTIYRDEIVECWSAALARKNHEEDQHCMVDVVGSEKGGQKALVRESRRIPDSTQQYGFRSEPDLVEREVPAFKRLKDRPEIKSLAAAAEFEARDAERKARERRERFIGMGVPVGGALEETGGESSKPANEPDPPAVVRSGEAGRSPRGNTGNR